MSLADLVARLGDTEDPEARMQLVADALSIAPAQTDPALLLASAWHAHAAHEYLLASRLWQRAREVAHTDTQRYDATSGLFFELQRIALETPEFATKPDERLGLAADLLQQLDALPIGAGPADRAWERSVITGHRATLQLNAARQGRLDLLPGARRDFGAELAWLLDGRDVPAHLQRRHLIALARINLGEVLLLEGDLDEAIEQLETGIAALEATNAGEHFTERAYALLDRAENA